MALRRITVDLPSELHHKVKVFCAENDIKMRDLIMNSLNIFLKDKDDNNQFYRDLKKGIKECIDYEEGKLELRTNL